MDMELSGLVIYDSVLFQVGHHVSRWANSVERGFVMNAREAAPMRSGELRAGIHGESFRSGPKHWEVHIHSDAEHTMYVLRGTTGPIMSTRMWGFRTRTGLMFPRGGSVGRGSERNMGLPNIPFLKERGYLLNVRAGNGFPQRYMVKVRGQRPNNFFAPAADATARRHPSLRGFNPGFEF